MYWYVSPVVSAIEKSDLDQILGRKRPSSRWGLTFCVVFARRASPCSSLPTLPKATSSVLASYPDQGCSFRSFVEIIFQSLISVRTYRYISIWHVSCKNTSGWTGRFNSISIFAWFASVLFSFLVCRLIFTSFCLASCGLTTEYL